MAYAGRTKSDWCHWIACWCGVRAGELPDFLSQLPIAKEYTLVYDLDLNKLQHDIKYDADNSGQIKSFDRIGYLLETSASDGGEQADLRVDECIHR